METGFNILTTKASRLAHTPHIPFNPENARTGTMQLQCEVMFGSPSSNCGGNGICKIVAKSIHPLSVFKRASCSHAKALFTTQGDGKDASLIFRRDWLCSNLMRQHLRHGILEMPEPCPIPPGIVTTLGLKVSELPAGLHLIEDYGTHIKINFLHTELI
jgi:hypothetical protein